MSIALLLAFATAAVPSHADQDQHRRDDRSNVQAREIAEAYSAQFRAERLARQTQPASAYQPPPGQSGQNASERLQNSNRAPAAAAEESQRAARLSQDERNALRRSVNEAAGILYAPIRRP